MIKVEAERLFATADRTTLLVAGYKRSDQIRSAARMPRRKDAFKAALSQAMHSRKAEMMPFKEFMEPAWTLGHINGFTATTTPDAKAYMVRDENGDLGERRYTWGTLERMVFRELIITASVASGKPTSTNTACTKHAVASNGWAVTPIACNRKACNDRHNPH